jgi:hypothetical protein
MNDSICIFTLSTYSHLKASIVSLESFKKNIHNFNVDCFILTVEEIDKAISDKIYELNNIKIINLQNIESYNIQGLINKYKNKKDILRWSSKPSSLLYFSLKYDIVFYIDNDIYFINPCDFLIKDYLNKGMCLTKHNRCINPFKEHVNEQSKIYYPNVTHKQFKFNQFQCLFTDGFFNAGFIGIRSKNIQDALYWWSDMVLFNCSINRQQGIYLDQKYLDILALEFDEKISIIHDANCNVAHWNILSSEVSNPIFFHFSGGKNYQKIHPLLFENYQKYISAIDDIEL